MQVNSVSQQRILTPKTTGYTATAGMALTILSGVTKNKTIRKQHKMIAYLTAIATALHISLIEFYHHKYKTQR